MGGGSGMTAGISGSGIIIGVKSAGFPGVCDEFSPESDLSVNCGIEFSLPFILFFLNIFSNFWYVPKIMSSFSSFEFFLVLLPCEAR